MWPCNLMLDRILNCISLLLIQILEPFISEIVIVQNFFNFVKLLSILHKLSLSLFLTYLFLLYCIKVIDMPRSYLDQQFSKFNGLTSGMISNYEIVWAHWKAKRKIMIVMFSIKWEKFPKHLCMSDKQTRK